MMRGQGHGPPGEVSLDGELTDAVSAASKKFNRLIWSCATRPTVRRVRSARIAARRLIAILDLCEATLSRSVSNKARRTIKRSFDSLDKLRDLHVQHAYVTELEPGFPALRPLRRKLETKAEGAAREARRALQRHPADKATAKIVNRIRKAVISRPPRLVDACRGCEEAFVQTLRLHDAIDAQDTETIHATRVAFKRFRYMVESLPSLRAHWGASRVRAMRAYQRRMGNIQDMEVLLQTMRRFADRHPRRAKDLHPVIRRLTSRHSRFVRDYMRTADTLTTFRAPELP